MLNNEIQNQIAKKIQQNFPIVEKPFHQIAKDLSVTSDEVIHQLHEWKNKKYLREISAIMEGEILGYESALVYGKVKDEDLENVVEILKKHPTITHLYLRNYEINLWFTISVSKEISLKKHLDVISELTNCSFYPLRRKKTFKIGVNFDLENKINQTEIKELPESLPVFPENLITEEVKQIIRAIQTPLPLIDEPFKILAENFNLTQNQILSFLEHPPFQCVRKYVATFNHRNLGVNYNAMTVWKVSEEILDKKGKEVARFPEISHCYSRETTKEFPYNLYTMIHGPNEQVVKKIIKKISESTGLNDFLILYSPIEYKKCRLRYFLKELEEWENHYVFKVAYK